MSRLRIAVVALAGFALLACDDEISQPGTGSPRQSAAAAASAVAETRPPVKIDIREADFVETEGNRDPFRSYAQAFVEESRGQVRSQREVVLEQYALDELKLIGLITGTKPERAMLVDPTGLGHVVTRGQFIGRAQIVQPAGGVGAAYEVNWRVDRIRDGDLILVRDDPSNPEVPSATRVMPLRTDEVSTAESAESGSDVEGQLSQLKQQIQAMEAAEAARKPAGDKSASQ